MHGKTSQITHKGESVFKGLPSPFTATRYHSLIVAREGLPSVLAVTAETEDGIIMGLMHKTLPIHGVQFHPESIATEHGHALLRNFLALDSQAFAGMTSMPLSKSALQKIERGEDLSAAEARAAFDHIFEGKIPAEQIGSFLFGLHKKGETVDELTGAVASMRSKMIAIKAPAGAIDIVGTGGDAHGTLNISTAAALVVAGCGVPVAKHGNRAASSKSGSSDVLAALGVNLEPSTKTLERCLAEANLCFLLRAASSSGDAACGRDTQETRHSHDF